MFTERERSQIADAIAEIENRTDAELVAVLAAHSDDYWHHSLAWAALAALLVPAPLVLTSASVYLILSVQLGLFCLLALAFRIPSLAQRLVPRRSGHWHASNLARRQFLEQGLHRTKNATGVLIFVSEAERYVEILADRGVSAHVDDARWQAIIDRFVVNVQRKQVHSGFLKAIAECGDILAETVPKSADDRNELPNRLVLIGYE